MKRLAFIVLVLAIVSVVTSQPKLVQAANALDLASLLGGYIVAEDGQYLGKISTSTVDTDSIMNTVGRYGCRLHRW